MGGIEIGGGYELVMDSTGMPVGIAGPNGMSRFPTLDADGSLIIAGNVLDTTATYVAPLTGANVTVPEICNNFIVNAAGSLNALTITMPLTPENGQTLTISSTHGISSLTLAGNGTTVLGWTNLSSLNATAALIFLFSDGSMPNSPVNTWVRQN